jgi:hypothetical protein
MTVTRVGDRTGQDKSKAAPTSVVEMQYKAMTGKERVEFNLLVRRELYDAVPGAIRTLAGMVNEGKNTQHAVAAARRILLLSEKHGVLKSSSDPLSEFTESLRAELQDLEDRRED